MKIGVYCTNNLIYPTPENVICANMDVAGNLSDTLTEMGHEVTFFAPIGTTTKAQLVTFDMLPFNDESVYKTYPHQDASYHYENIMMVKALAYMQQHNFNVFSSHTRPFSVIEFAPLISPIPTVVTVHDPLSDSGYDILPWYNQFRNLYFVSLSLSQQRTKPKLNWAGNVYNGIDVERWPFTEKQGSYLLFVGRIIPEKGVDTAVKIAVETGMPLKIVGTIYDHSQTYFNETIKPFLSDTIEYLGPKSPNELVTLYQNAYALLNPIRWEEPFGLVMIEAMACGTPVLATRRGSVPEIVVHGETGFISEGTTDVGEITAYVGKVPQLMRENCRKMVERNFSIQTMATTYTNLFEKIIQP